MVRFAFTLIELIFAIVVIGIAVLSLPMMNQATSKAIDNNLIQEAIFAGATQLNEAVTAHWDENSIEPNNINSYARIICTTNRAGLIPQPLHRKCLENNQTIISNANTNPNIDSLDDMNDTSYQDIFINEAVGNNAYKNNYKSLVTVSQNVIFGEDTINPNIDIKRINIKIKNSKGDLITSLNSYSANIGEVDYYKRNFQ